MKKITLYLSVALLLLAPVGVRAEIDQHFQPLVQKLHGAGLNKQWLEEVFSQPCVRLSHRVLLLRLTVRESKINYGQFSQEPSLRKARDFMALHADALDKAQEEYGVPKEVLTAVLLLETRLGEHTGGFQTLSTLATHASAGQKKIATDVYNRLPEKEKKRWTPQTAAERLGNRVEWSFNELKAFLEYAAATKADPCQVNGSYTGAIGLCQFQPSNLKPYGRDGNADGVTDLFQVEDAIFSAANYLKKHGWNPKLGEDGRVRVLMTYNNSKPYARTILEVARRLAP